jgi:ribosomal protein S18 acetylase RimI-like enzyme
MIRIRQATEDDVPNIYKMICELASYEKALDKVKTDVNQLKKDGFGENPLFKCLIVEHDSEVVGYAFYYYRYSTWMGKNIYLEDLYISPKKRGLKLGLRVMIELAKIAVETECQRFEWQVLDWNEPAIKFYKSINTDLENDWLNCKLETTRIHELANTKI